MQSDQSWTRQRPGISFASSLAANARTLDDVRGLVSERGRVTRRPNIRAAPGRTWDDLPAVKRWLLEDLTRERNEYAKRLVQEFKD